MRAEQLTGPVALHGEGPAWSPAWRGIRWVDMLAGDILELDENGFIQRVHVGDIACMVRRRSQRGCVVATERGIFVSNSDNLDAELILLTNCVEQANVRLNEGSCAPDGSLLVGSMSYIGESGAGTLWSVDSSGRRATVIEGVTVSNGVAWDPSGELVYYVDSPTNRIDVLDWTANDGLTGRRSFASVQSPDGLCVDSEGGVWVALYGGGAVHRYDKHGRLSAVVEVPVPFVTAVCFAGNDLERLVISTSRLESPDETRGGALFQIQPGVRGLALNEFAG